MDRLCWRWCGVWLVVAASAALPRAAQQGAAAGRIEYAAADIAYGAQLYAAQCSTCHGPDGAGGGGVGLRSGTFPNATTDQDLTRVITTGIAGTGMVGFRLDTAEIAGVVAFIRNMNSVDASSVKGGDPARGRQLLERHGCLRCHRVGAQGARVAPDLS